MGLIVFIEGDGCYNICAGEGDGFGEEEDAHYEDGGDGHEGSKAGCLFLVFFLIILCSVCVIFSACLGECIKTKGRDGEL